MLACAENVTMVMNVAHQLPVIKPSDKLTFPEPSAPLAHKSQSASSDIRRLGIFHGDEIHSVPSSGENWLKSNHDQSDGGQNHRTIYATGGR